MNARSNRAIFLVGAGHFTLELCQQYLPVYYSALVDRGMLSLSQVGLVALVSTLAGSVAMPLFGHWSDRWERRRVTSASILWLGLFMALLGFSGSNYALLLVLVALAGLGSAAFHPAAAAVVAQNSGPRKGAALSVFSVGGNLGSAMSPLLIGLGLGLAGLRGTLIVLPFSLVMGLLVYRGLGHATSRRVRRAEDLASVEAPRGLLAGLILLVLAVMTRSWYQMVLMTYLPSWIVERGGSLADGSTMLFVLALCLGFGSLLGGPLSDRVGRWQVLLGGMMLLAPLHWIFMRSGGTLQLGVVGGLGLAVGTGFPVAIALAQEVWPSGTGMAAGAIMGLGWLPGGIGASVTGFVAERYSLDVGLWTLIAFPVLGVVCMGAFVVLWHAHMRDVEPTPQEA